ncbi:DUF6292 family protein [Lentzea sp. NPDC042327]|uniref:DUF6292 family protein n=1 Tax=Lentzea sp. NPDC042327 TaxID=3154801 RepID=UPI0033C154A7
MMTPALDYALRVTRELGLSGESSCVDSEKPLRLYIAVEGRLPGHPDHEVALLWTECHGWAIAVERPDTAEVTVVEHLGGAVEPPPRTVARWVRRVLARADRQTAATETHTHPGQVA